MDFLSFSTTCTNETINNKSNAENTFHIICVLKRKKDFVFFFHIPTEIFIKLIELISIHWGFK